MTALESALADYLAVRRALGYKLASDGHLLAAFVAHLDANEIDTVTVAVAAEWAAATRRGGPGADRLTVVRGFARYLQALDPAHEVPPTRLLAGRTSRPVPFLYSEDHIATLMAAARALTPDEWGATVEVIIGLLWTTGMRIGEVLRLDVDDLEARHARVDRAPGQVRALPARPDHPEHHPSPL